MDEYKYLVADFPKLMKFIQKQFKMKASLMEDVVYEIIQEAEEEGLVASTLKSAVSEMLAGDDSSEREVKFLDQEFPVTNEDTLERNQERSKKSEVDRKFLLKRGEVVNL